MILELFQEMNEAGKIMVEVKMSGSEEHAKVDLALGLRGFPRSSGLDKEIVSDKPA